MVYKVLNTDIFLTQHIHSLQKAFINPPEPCGVLFMMDGCTLLDFKISTPIHCHCPGYSNARKSWDIFLNITLIVFV